MVLGPLWPTTSPASPAVDEAECVRRCAEVGAELAARFAQAESQTNGWADRELAGMLIDTALQDALREIATTNVWGPENRPPSHELWSAAEQWLVRGRLQRHARQKPLGYAGDYQMMQWIWRQEAVDDPLGEIFDRFFLRQAAPAAVRGRISGVAKRIVAAALDRSQPLRVLSVSGGPAFEIAQAASVLTPRGKRLETTLLDIDPRALDLAERGLAEHLPADQIRRWRVNPVRLRRQLNGDHRESADIVVCTGLFDYLEDDVAVDLIDTFVELLAPGGQMLIGQFSRHNPSRAYMEWIGNWYLHYREPEALAALAREAAARGCTVEVGAESLGVNLFLRVKLPR